MVEDSNWEVQGSWFRIEGGGARRVKLSDACLVATKHALEEEEAPEDLPAGDLLAEAVATGDTAFHQAHVGVSQSSSYSPTGDPALSSTIPYTDPASPPID